MIKFEDIRHVHLEISSLCNASCPWCPRTFWGYPYNGGYPEVNLTLDMSKKIFTPEFLQQLKVIQINGNFGDIVMNPEGAEIVEYFRSQNHNLEFEISTNGGARNPAFWQKLAEQRATVEFCIDGLEDTHHLYRQNTVWQTIINNAQIFIKAGGRAIWKMIKFDHNLHQFDQCRQMSKDLGFYNFETVDDGRDTAPVFNKQGKLTHTLGQYTGDTDFKVMFHKKKTDLILLEDILSGRSPKKSVDCYAVKLKSIYIAANGDVSPCCHTGFYPKTYGHGQYHQAANSQLNPIIHKNNAITYPLQECIEWFAEVKNSWTVDTYENGRLVICDDVCGK
jgi:sulfatase maturation enzyme AslB (radical SAM superfamily)